jgi:hypothetical protein
MSRLRRVGLWIGYCLLVLVLGSGAIVFAFFHRFYPRAPPANFPLAHDLVTAQHQDLSYFRRYLNLDRAYSPDARRQATQLLTHHQTRAGSLTSAQFDLAISRMVALADNGHSAVYQGYLACE